MKVGYENTDPEKAIFGAALNSIEIEPSEKFWNSALDGIINKENNRFRKQAKTWKAVSFALGGILVLFFLHDMLTNFRIDKIQVSLAALQADRSDMIKNQKNLTVEYNNRLIQNPPVSNRSISGAAETAYAKQTGGVKNKPFEAKPQRNLKYNTSEDNVSAPAKNSPASVPALNSNELSQFKQPGNIEQNTISAANAKLDGYKYSPDSVRKNASPFAGKSGAETAYNSLTTNDAQNSKSNKTDTVNIPATEQQPKRSFSLKNKVSIGAFFAPGTTNDFLKDRDNDNNDNIMITDVKERQNPDFAYETGIKLGIDLSRKITISTGFFYNLYSYEIKQTVINAQQQEGGSVGYSIITSSGIVNIPYSASSPKIGDSMKVHGNSARGYFGIPLQLSYTAWAHNKFKLYVIGGLAAEIAVCQRTELTWQNTFLQDGSVNVESVEGLNTLNFNYSIGLGAQYQVGKGFSIFAEPQVQGALTSINQDTPIITYPYFFSCALGLTYYL